MVSRDLLSDDPLAFRSSISWLDLHSMQSVVTGRALRRSIPIFSPHSLQMPIAVVEPPQRFLHLEDQFTFTVAYTQNRVSVRFHGCPIGGIWKILRLRPCSHSFACFRTEFLHPLVQKISKDSTSLLVTLGSPSCGEVYNIIRFRCKIEETQRKGKSREFSRRRSQGRGCTRTKISVALGSIARLNSNWEFAIFRTG